MGAPRGVPMSRRRLEVAPLVPDAPGQGVSVRCRNCLEGRGFLLADDPRIQEVTASMRRELQRYRHGMPSEFADDMSGFVGNLTVGQLEGLAGILSAEQIAVLVKHR